MKTTFFLFTAVLLEIGTCQISDKVTGDDTTTNGSSIIPLNRFASSGLDASSNATKQKRHGKKKEPSSISENKVNTEGEALFPLGHLPRSYKHMKLFEGDIIPNANVIRAVYGKKVVDNLRKKGILPGHKHKHNHKHNDKHKHQHQHQHATENNKIHLVSGGWGVLTDYRWNTRVGDVVQVPYMFKDGNFSPKDQKLVVDSLADLERASGVVQFVPRTTEKNYVLVVDAAGCSSNVGNINEGGQVLTLNNPGCLYKGIIQHEFLHALGFFHEQNRPDRESYVTVHYENIETDMISNFSLEKEDKSLGSPYDYDSVMHYSRNEFSKNGKDTITPLEHKEIGQRKGASHLDIQLIRLLYQCKSGSRNLESYSSNLCTDDCKCWEGAHGCVGDNSCQGSLVCKDEKCHSNNRNHKNLRASK